MRYLLSAFFARPNWPLFRLLPWNALAVVAAGVAGIWEPSIWATAGIGELIYLLTLSTNPGFQQSVDTTQQAVAIGDSETARRDLLSQVGGAARQRYVKLEEKRKKLEALGREQSSDDLLAESNHDALRRLTWLFLQLLIAQRSLIVGPKSDEKEIATQIAALERELADPALTTTVRGAKEATLRLLRDRLDNLSQKGTSLAEIEADLQRIEAQVDLALEEAALRGTPVAISANVELTSRLLDNMNEEFGVVESHNQTTISQ